MTTLKKITITNLDYIRLKNMISEYSKRNKTDANIEDLLGEIERAQKVDSKQIPKNVVTMNSIIEIKNLEQNKISILAPIATACIGYKIGDVIQWNIPNGIHQFQITGINYQPEANGDFHL